jgi:3-oxoacyl-[acyl-carrier protein] reductase
MASRDDEHSLVGRRALVCGASAGIGRAAAGAIAARGGRVLLLARRGDALAGAEAEIREKGGDARAVVADLDDRPAVRRVVEDLLADEGAIHVLVNNAGGPPSGTLLEATEDGLLHAFGRHVLASQLLTTTCLPGMREAGYGRIVNVISLSVREPIPGLGVSNVIRGAMASWAKTLSRELPPGVTINNVLPGYTDTERLAELATQMAASGGTEEAAIRADWMSRVPEGRLGRPEELGEAVAFLASPAASYIRGVSLPVDGGRLMGI